MEPNSVAEDLPALYRAVLDQVAQLEANGQRDLAAQIRSQAIRIYSRAWDARARRDLEAILRRHAGPALAPPVHGRGLRRRTIRAA
jgi:hypothetical protein